MRSIVLAMAVTAVGCAAGRKTAATQSGEPTGFPARAAFVLTGLDERTVPTEYADPHGRYTLKAGELTLAPNGDLWLTLDLVPLPDTVAGRVVRSTLVESYRRVGTDSIIFPAVSGHDDVVAPEFFGRRRGDELTLVARPLPLSDMKPGVISVARDHGGPHTWRFHVRSPTSR